MIEFIPLKNQAKYNKTFKYCFDDTLIQLQSLEVSWNIVPTPTEVSLAGKVLSTVNCLHDPFLLLFMSIFNIQGRLLLKDFPMQDEDWDSSLSNNRIDKREFLQYFENTCTCLHGCLWFVCILALTQLL